VFQFQLAKDHTPGELAGVSIPGVAENLMGGLRAGPKLSLAVASGF
jgi:hypothetical protein